MKIVAKVEKEINIKYVLIDISPRYIGDSQDDDVPSDFPLLNGENWKAYVDVDTHLIKDWPIGIDARLQAKVCDAGSYYLIDDMENIVASKENDYVPNGLVPGKYGDYIDLDIDIDGRIKNWPIYPDFSTFFDD